MILQLGILTRLPMDNGVCILSECSRTGCIGLETLGPKEPANGGCEIQNQILQSIFITMKIKRKRYTLILTASGKLRDPSNALLSSILNMRCPSELAITLIAFSLAVTASNEPSLLNLNLGLACMPYKHRLNEGGKKTTQ